LLRSRRSPCRGKSRKNAGRDWIQFAPDWIQSIMASNGAQLRGRRNRFRRQSGRNRKTAVSDASIAPQTPVRMSMTFRLRMVAVSIAMIAGGAMLVAQAPDFKRVTDAILQNPDPSDWINYRRTQDAWGYSPLNQITTRNVNQLQLAWSWTLGAGISEPTPLVYNGVMYLPNPNGLVQALDAATGELMWEFNRESPRRGYGMMRSLAIYDDKIYVPTRDAHVIALNARTGNVVWDHTVADATKGYHYTSGPLIVKGKVVVGMQGCQTYKDDVCFISAYDAQTGAELWR